MSEKLNQLKALLGEVADIGRAASVLELGPAGEYAARRQRSAWTTTCHFEQDRTGKIHYR